jgi:hypothetical protein
MKPNDDDLFKPLSGKTGRKAYSPGGREIDPTRRHGSAGSKWDAFQKRRKKDADRRAKGTLS